MDPDNQKKESVHGILAHSYTVYFVFLIIGILLDLIFPIRLIPNQISGAIGLTLIVIGPLLILWAQRTSLAIRNKMEKLTRDDFKHGPYSITRHPTYLGVIFMVLGFGFLVNSIVIIAASIIAALFTKFYYIKREELLLEKNYGDDYIEYKKNTSSWL
ncbi:MAG: Isoprenylcysteine carboxyl methyltransferase [Candidatus Nomurabacteria bacterium GW2011_GWB1_37_5]|uniref:Isoprenylcysteine carboxyl methyltransferase n=1 Tax=Candidatus Nomurabacteria bacterium GW2011_GWB1_37_5 TaxID=1618742 RepID=A0A0G0HBI3_9BACT|nr:MAG: Isoprenylcysteine carboxyl methyltransferase [Candidatus Nomurabacteria bacterium GW2011_GWB1_37_5]